MLDDKYQIPSPQKPEPTEQKPHIITVLLSVAALIVALLAACFTFWQAYEAYEARIDARNASDVQQEDIKEAKRAAERSATAAEMTVRGAEARFRDEQRPWIGPTFSITALSPAGMVAVTYRNTGKTPAFEVLATMSVDVIAGFPRTFPISFFKYYKTGERTSRDVLFPDVPMALDSELNGLTELQIRAIAARQATLFIHGQIDYKDMFKRPHETQFCDFYLPSQTVLTPCPYHNPAN